MSVPTIASISGVAQAQGLALVALFTDGQVMVGNPATGTSNYAWTSVNVPNPLNSAPISMTYSNPTAIRTKGVAIIANIPALGGGGVSATYTVSPALPAGLTLNANSGVITGTPSAVTAVNTYVVTATNSYGSTTANVVLTVNDAAPFNLNYASSGVVFTRNSAITAISPTYFGGLVTAFSVAPALPAGLSLNPGTGVLSGTPTAPTAAAVYVVTATNTGGTTTSSLNLTVKDIPPTGLTYASNPVSYSKASGAITPNLPSNTGGTATSYRVPSLPPGLSLDLSTGAISGTPTTIAAQASFTVTASNAYGSTTVAVLITITA